MIPYTFSLRLEIAKWALVNSKILKSQVPQGAM